ncbi:hypothetical protein BGX31_007094 [Mortierella sp. GBA43]|nr:hypothetical protein BGX31_007094 [Mortierella sp. GBA43]
MAFKRPYMPSHHANNVDKPWLKYPDPEKPSNVHSRSLSPLPHKPSPGLKHKRSLSKVSAASSSNASLPMSLASNSSSDSLGHPHANINSRTGYPSPITPSDILGIADLATPASPTSSAPSSPQNPQADLKGDSKRPSPLSINTSFSLDGSSFSSGAKNPALHCPTAPSDVLDPPHVNLGVASGPGTPPLPKLSHSSSHSSSASNSSYSNSSSPSSATAPCSVLCHHTKGHGHHHHSHPHSSQNHHHHHHCCHHKHERSRHHHPSCQHHGSTRHGSRSDKASKGQHRYGAPQYVPSHEAEPSALSNTDVVQTDAVPSEEPLEIPEETTSTAVTIVGSTPAFGIDSFRSEGDDVDMAALSAYETEPPKKRQRSTAAVILGAAVETVIFTSAVALSAYQLLTGKGRQQLEAAMAQGANVAAAEDFENKEELTDDVLLAKTAPVNIPTTTRHRHSGGQLGKSLHHHHKSRHSKLSKARNGLSISLPHLYGNGEDIMADLNLPERPNTGTEDSDEQFLRLEAQFSTLITEGKRQLNARIPDLHGEA